MLLLGCRFKNLPLVSGKYVFQILTAIVLSCIKKGQNFFDLEEKTTEFSKATEDFLDVL